MINSHSAILEHSGTVQMPFPCTLIRKWKLSFHLMNFILMGALTPRLVWCTLYTIVSICQLHCKSLSFWSCSVFMCCYVFLLPSLCSLLFLTTYYVFSLPSIQPLLTHSLPVAGSEWVKSVQLTFSHVILSLTWTSIPTLHILFPIRNAVT